MRVLDFVHPRVKNCRLQFQQSLSHFAYFWHVYILLSHYCKSMPNLYTRKTNGTLCYTLDLHTRSLPCFTEIYHLFYLEGKKIVPVDIFYLLTPIALAH
jgi:hypothetical protein